jgi:ubiquinol-cytochrome c reductase cytochrome c subunit
MVRPMRMTTTTQLCIAGAFAAVAASDARAQDVERGRESYATYGCYQCHGYVGQGGAARRVAPSPYPYEAFERLVRRPANEMPAYAPSVLDDETLRAIYAYVMSIPRQPYVDEIVDSTTAR